MSIAPPRPRSILGTGWSFPPQFAPEVGVVMTSDEADIEASLRVLLGTVAGERILKPEYGLNLRDAVFEPMSTTATSLLVDRVKRGLLIFEPRIDLLGLSLDTSRQNEGALVLTLEYRIIATNSRFNLVFPFYLHDATEGSP